MDLEYVVLSLGGRQLQQHTQLFSMSIKSFIELLEMSLELNLGCKHFLEFSFLNFQV